MEASRFGISLAALVLAVPISARAAEPDAGGAAAEPAQNPAVIEPKELPDAPAFIDTTWTRPPARFFLSSAIDLGVAYARPRVSFGYGRPHRHWAGIDMNPVLTSTALGAYGGLRYAGPVLDVRAGGRYFYGLYRSYLPIQDSYTREDIDFRGGSRAQYFTLEGEVTLAIPAGPGDIISETGGTRIFGVPDDRYVFEETLHVVAAPPYVVKQRLGYSLKLLADDELRIALVGDVLGIPERDALVLRAGLVVHFRLFDDLELRASFVPVVASPDTIGIAGGDFGEYGVRWRWATGP